MNKTVLVGDTFTLRAKPVLARPDIPPLDSDAFRWTVDRPGVVEMDARGDVTTFTALAPGQCFVSCNVGDWEEAVTVVVLDKQATLLGLSIVEA